MLADPRAVSRLESAGHTVTHRAQPFPLSQLRSALPDSVHGSSHPPAHPLHDLEDEFPGAGGPPFTWSLSSTLLREEASGEAEGFLRGRAELLSPRLPCCSPGWLGSPLVKQPSLPPAGEDRGFPGQLRCGGVARS